MIKVAINGFGRIGRLVFRLMEENPNFEVVAINDLTDAEQLAYLLKYDTNHRNYRLDEISFEGNDIIVGNHKVRILAEMDPKNLPWKDMDIDIVMEFGDDLIIVRPSNIAMADASVILIDKMIFDDKIRQSYSPVSA